MVNHVRGFVEVDLGAEKVSLTLGLGALAELEDAFCVEAFEDALNFGDKVSAKRLRTFFHALLRGNGIDLTPAREKSINQMSPADFMDVLTTVMSAAGLAQEAEGQSAGANASSPLADANAGAPG